MLLVKSEEENSHLEVRCALLCSLYDCWFAIMFACNAFVRYYFMSLFQRRGFEALFCIWVTAIRAQTKLPWAIDTWPKCFFGGKKTTFWAAPHFHSPGQLICFYINISFKHRNRNLVTIFHQDRVLNSYPLPYKLKSNATDVIFPGNWWFSRISWFIKLF